MRCAYCALLRLDAVCRLRRNRGAFGQDDGALRPLDVIAVAVNHAGTEVRDSALTSGALV
jgi:hypothetical protein